MCKSSQLGQFITHIPSDQANTTSVYTKTLTLSGNETEAALYKVDATGYYCVALTSTASTNQTDSFFEAWVEWKFPYGELPATDYPKLLVSM